MKHRSVIAFVIVAGALFALPQLSHDLQTFKGAVGSRLRGELLQAFLSLHTDDATTTETATSPRRAQTLLASCTKGKTDAPTAKSKKGEPRASLEPRGDATSTETVREQMALTTQRRVEANGEVAMIIPPDSGIDPHALADLSAAWSKTQEGSAREQRKVAAEMRRVAYVTTRLDGNNVEWRKAGEEALRSLNATTLPGTFEFRLVRDGSKTKVLKFIRRNGDAGHQPATVPAPRAPRLPGQVARLAPAPDAQASSDDE
ncbi:MAG: hypothetical protein QOJ70_3129 [Acidobacteriota bacterium]|jgi:hypothetical protein|nr:hypothetical protein [Acidobacteriota bacterium]